MSSTGSVEAGLPLSDPKIYSDKEAENSLVLPLIAIAKLTRVILGMRLSAIGLHSGQDEALMALKPHEPMMVSHLAEKLMVRASTISKMIDRLVEKNLVIRTSSKDDGRSSLILITEAGLEMRARIQILREDAEQYFAREVEDVELLAGQLRLAEKILTARLRRLR